MTRRFFVYLLVIAASVSAVAALIHFGETRLSTESLHVVAAPPPSAASAAAQMLDNARLPLPRLILQLILIVVAARAMGLVARRFGQPAVIGEIAAGVLLGPSLFGWIAPGPSAFLFP